MRTLSSLVKREVVTEGGRKLGTCHDVRAELTQSSLKVTGLCVGGGGWVEHFGMRRKQRTRGHDPVPWEAVVRVEGDRIIVHDIQ
jgi:sporulation protein YlmC with PRC-barrel domain